MKSLLEFIRGMIEDAMRRNAREIVIHAPLTAVCNELEKQMRGVTVSNIDTLYGYPIKNSREVWLEIDSSSSGIASNATSGQRRTTYSTSFTR